MVQRAIDRGLDREVADDLCVQLLQLDLWRMELGADPPAKAPPFLVSLKPGAKPFRAGTRRQSDVPRASLNADHDRMVELGLMYFNPNPRWGSAGVHLPKPGRSGLGWGVD